jgi:MFS family permease
MLDESKEKLSVFLISLLAFLASTGASLLRPYLPIFSRLEFGASLVEVGIVAAAGVLISAALAIPNGLLSAYIGRAKLVTLGTLWWGAGIMTLAFTPDLLSLIILYMLAGAGHAMYDVNASALVGDVSSTRRFARSYGYFTTGIGTGYALGPAIGGVIIDLVGYRSAIFTGGVLTLLAFVVSSIVFFLVRPFDKARPISMSNFRSEVRGNRRLWIGIFFMFLTPVAQLGLQAFLPLYARFIGIDAVSTGLLFTVQFVAISFSRLLFGTLLDKEHNMIRFILLGFAVTALSNAALGLIPNLAYLMFMLVISGLGFGSVNIVANVMVARATSIELRGFGLALAAFARYLAYMAGPLMIGTSLAFTGESQIGYGISFAVVAIPSLVGVLYTIYARSRKAL